MFAAIALTAALAAAPPPAPRAPAAREAEGPALVLHGEQLRDEYAWLKAGPDDPAVREHLAAENEYAEAWLRPHARLIATLAREIERQAYVAEETAPVRRGEWVYWSRQSSAQDHPVLLRRPAARPDAPPQVLLDLNLLARGKPYFALGLLELSDDGRHLAYAVDERGDEEFTLRIKDLATGALAPEIIERVTSAAWSASGQELLYTVRDDTFRSYALRSRSRPDGADRLVFEEEDPRFDLDISRTRSGEWLVLSSDAYHASEARVARAERPAEWRPIVRREPGHLYEVDHVGDTFLIRSNRGAPRFAVFAAPEENPHPWLWRELVAQRPDGAITGLDAFAGHLVLHLRERGQPRLALLDLQSGVLDPLPRATFNRDVVGLDAEENPEHDVRTYRLRVTSVHEGERTLALALGTGDEEVLHQRKIPGPCGGTARLVAAARAEDGAAVPYLRFSGTDAGPGPRPLLLEAYGSYGDVFDPSFDAGRCALLNRGVDFAIAWVRGGGELGEPWHDAGRRRRRLTAISDLVAVAEHLITGGATTPAQLVIAGDSAGGGLVAASVARRPELFAAAVLRVPFLDAVGTMADPNAPLTTLEYDEWGDPHVREDYDVLRRWCPYTNLAPGTFPAVLVESSLADARVAYHEQTRYVARLRRLAAGGPFLLKTERDASHAGASGRRAWVRARAFEAAFILWQVGRAT